jgi:multidrug efflux pump
VMGGMITATALAVFFVPVFFVVVRRLFRRRSPPSAPLATPAAAQGGQS